MHRGLNRRSATHCSSLPWQRDEPYEEEAHDVLIVGVAIRDRIAAGRVVEPLAPTQLTGPVPVADGPAPLRLMKRFLPRYLNVNKMLRAADALLQQGLVLLLDRVSAESDFTIARQPAGPSGTGRLGHLQGI